MPILAFTEANMRAEVRRQLQERAEARFLDVDITWWLNEGIAYIASVTRCLRSSATATTTAGTEEYNAPISALGSWGVTRVDYNSGELEEVPFERRREHMPDGVDPDVSGTPYRWSPYGATVILTPAPAAALTLKQWFAHLADSVSAGDESLPLPDVYGPAVIEYAVHKGEKLRGNEQESGARWQKFQQMLQGLAGKRMPDVEQGDSQSV